MMMNAWKPCSTLFKKGDNTIALKAFMGNKFNILISAAIFVTTVYYLWIKIKKRNSNTNKKKNENEQVDTFDECPILTCAESYDVSDNMVCVQYTDNDNITKVNTVMDESFTAELCNDFKGMRITTPQSKDNDGSNIENYFTTFEKPNVCVDDNGKAEDIQSHKLISSKDKELIDELEEGEVHDNDDIERNVTLEEKTMNEEKEMEICQNEELIEELEDGEIRDDDIDDIKIMCEKESEGKIAELEDTIVDDSRTDKNTEISVVEESIQELEDGEIEDNKKIDKKEETDTCYNIEITKAKEIFEGEEIVEKMEKDELITCVEITKDVDIMEDNELSDLLEENEILEEMEIMGSLTLEVNEIEENDEIPKERENAEKNEISEVTEYKAMLEKNNIALERVIEGKHEITQGTEIVGMSEILEEKEIVEKNEFQERETIENSAILKEKEIVENKEIAEEKDDEVIEDNEILEEAEMIEFMTLEENEITENDETTKEREIIKNNEISEIAETIETSTSLEYKVTVEKNKIAEEREIDGKHKIMLGTETVEMSEILEEKEIDEKNEFQERETIENSAILEEKEIEKTNEIAEETEIVEKNEIMEGQDTVEMSEILKEKEMMETNEIAEETEIVEKNEFPKKRETIENSAILEEKEMLKSNEIIEVIAGKVIFEEKEGDEHDDKTEIVEEREVCEEKGAAYKNVVDEGNYNGEESPATLSDTYDYAIEDDDSLDNLMNYIDDCLNESSPDRATLTLKNDDRRSMSMENWQNDEASLDNIKRDFYELSETVCSPHPSSESDHAHCVNNLTERVAIHSAESILISSSVRIDPNVTPVLCSPINDDSCPELYVEKILFGDKELDVVYFDESVLQECGVISDVRIVRTIPVGISGRIIGKKGKTKNELLKKYGAELLIFNHPSEHCKQVLQITCNPSLQADLERWTDRTLEQISKSTIQTTVSNPEWLKPMIPLGKIVPVQIIDMPTIQHVKLRIHDPVMIRAYNKMQSDINEDYSKVDSNALLPSPVAIGCICIAMIRPDYFLRAEIISIYDQYAVVYLYDLGKTHQTCLFYLFKIREKYMKLPFQVIPARMPHSVIKNKKFTSAIVHKRFLCDQKTFKPQIVRAFFPRMNTCCEPCVHIYVSRADIDGRGTNSHNNDDCVDLLELLVSIDVCTMVRETVNCDLQAKMNENHFRNFANEKDKKKENTTTINTPVYFEPCNSKFYEDFLEFQYENGDSK